MQAVPLHAAHPQPATTTPSPAPALAATPAADRDLALVQGHVDGVCDRIAHALGMLPNGVKTLLARTRAWLEECIRRRLA
jgi:hypothetical protein